MKFWDLLNLIFENLGRRKSRVVMTAVGVVIGTAAVILLVSLAGGLQESATSNLYGIDDLTKIQVYPDYETEERYGSISVIGEAANELKTLTNPAIKELSEIEGVKMVIPQEYFYGMGIIQYRKLENFSQIMGVGTDNLENLGYEIDQGSMELRKGTAIIGYWVLQNFYDPNFRPGQDQPEPPDLLNQRIKIVLSRYDSDGIETKKTIDLTVVGILKEQRNEGDASVFVDLDELTSWNEWMNNGTRINRNKDGYNYVIVKAENVDQVMDITEKINELGFMAYSPQSMVEGVSNYYTILQLVFGGIGAIALLVAAIGIANTMTMAILERTREIGLIKAVGATNRDVLNIFLGEAAGIGFIGGLGGSLLGWLGTKAINIISASMVADQAQGGGMFSGLTTVVPPWLYIFSIIFATLVGLLSGLYPALNAATVAPIVALKYE